MGWLLFALLVLLLYVIFKPKNNSGSSTSIIDQQLVDRNREWAEYIAGYRATARNKSEKALVDRMLADMASKGLPVPPDVATDHAFAKQTGNDQPINVAAAETYFAENQSVTVDEDAPKIRQQPNQPPVNVQLDNASLLLYFGAFLFVASVGLFVAFSGVNGGLRTFAVLLVSLVMYAGGIGLHNNKPKLKQAGLAFVGIGMASAPFVGLAAYTYLFAQSNGTAVWFATSVLCLAMYAHALIVLRKPLLSYMLIFTFLSLFESGISIADAPVYAFGWGMAFVGILLSVLARWRGFWPEMQESTRVSAQVFLPIALAASTVMAAQEGIGQLGVSLLLAAAFYGLQTLSSKSTEQELNAVVAQVTTLFGAGTSAYALTNSWIVVSWVLVIFSLVQAAMILLYSKDTNLWHNFGSVLMATRLVGLFLAWQSPVALLAVAVSLPLMSGVVWLAQRRADAYVVSMLSVLLLPVIIGQGVMVNAPLGATSQALWVLGALLVQLAAFFWYRTKVDDTWKEVARYTYVISIAIAIICGLFAGPLVTLIICLAAALSVIVMAEYDHLPDWPVLAGALLIVPIFSAIGDEKLVLLTMVVALAGNIGLALHYRTDLNRWLSTGLWLVLPLGLGTGALGSEWNELTYSWAYFAVVLVLVFSRAIARGVLLVSSKASLASYARSASMSYVVGYIGAAVVALGVSLSGEDSQMYTTVMLVLLAVITWLLSAVIEKRADILAFIPFLLQGALLSGLRPELGTDGMITYLLASTALAAASYFVFVNTKDARTEFVQGGALLTAAITPVSVLFVQDSLWPMPLGLLVASGLLYYRIRQTNQANREFAVAGAVAAIMWFMYIAGVESIQAYTHVIAAMLAGYAYWRHKRGENEQSDSYLMAMLATATVPLVLQALVSTSGGIYGWWLLLEQIGFMLLGMSIRKKIVTRWGLYVSLAAVLYQLRGLGWAALAVLAIFIIGLAVYRLQKIDNKD